MEFVRGHFEGGPLTYDGHGGTDFAVRGFASVRRSGPWAKGPWPVISDVMVRDARSVMHRPRYRLRGTMSLGHGPRCNFEGA